MRKLDSFHIKVWFPYIIFRLINLYSTYYSYSGISKELSVVIHTVKHNYITSVITMRVLTTHCNNRGNIVVFDCMYYYTKLLTIV